MQSPRDLVAGIIKLSPGMQLGHHHFNRREVFFFVQVHRDAPAIVFYTHRAINMQLNLNVRAKPCQGFVDTVINNLIDKMMKTLGGNVSNIHGRTLAHGTESFQNGDLLGGILAFIAVDSTTQLGHD